MVIILSNKLFVALWKKWHAVFRPWPVNAWTTTRYLLSAQCTMRCMPLSEISALLETSRLESWRPVLSLYPKSVRLLMLWTNVYWTLVLRLINDKSARKFVNSWKNVEYCFKFKVCNIQYCSIVGIYDRPMYLDFDVAQPLPTNLLPCEFWNTTCLYYWMMNHIRK